MVDIMKGVGSLFQTIPADNSQENAYYQAQLNAWLKQQELQKQKELYGYQAQMDMQKKMAEQQLARQQAQEEAQFWQQNFGTPGQKEITRQGTYVMEGPLNEQGEQAMREGYGQRMSQPITELVQEGMAGSGMYTGIEPGSPQEAQMRFLQQHRTSGIPTMSETGQAMGKDLFTQRNQQLFQGVPEWQQKYQWMLENPEQAKELSRLGAIGGKAPSLPMDEQMKVEDQKFQMEMAKERIKAYHDTAYMASSSLPKIKRALDLLQKVNTGTFEATKLEAKRLLKSMGANVDVDKIATAEELQTIMGDFVMERVSQTKGAVSEKEMALFTEYSANFGKTPEGNRKILEFRLAEMERATKLQAELRKWAKQGKTLLERQELADRWLEENTIAGILQANDTSGFSIRRID